jgi:hypothetical protein
MSTMLWYWVGPKTVFEASSMAKSEFCTMGMSTNHLGLSLNSFGTEFSGY